MLSPFMCKFKWVKKCLKWPWGYCLNIGTEMEIVIAFMQQGGVKVPPSLCNEEQLPTLRAGY